MAPTFTDYLHGLRGLWWVPVLTLLVGAGLGLGLDSATRPAAETRGNALFTFEIDDPGDDSAGSARGAEAVVAQSRLDGYVQLARTSPQVREILASRGIEEPPTTFSPTGGVQDGKSRALIAASGAGIVEIRVRNKNLSQAEADQLVTALTTEVVRQSLATDAQQVTPSLRPDPLVTQPQVVEVPASRAVKLALPALLLTMLGLGLVYLMVWHQDRLYTRRDVEERVGARVLGDLAGRPADAPGIVLALTKGGVSGTRALIVPVLGASTPDSAWLGDSLAAAGRDLGLDVSLTSADTSIARPVGVRGADQLPGAPLGSPSAALALIEATGGLDAHALLAAGTADIVALVVTYGTSTYRDLNAAGRTLAEVTDAAVAVIGVHAPRAK